MKTKFFAALFSLIFLPLAVHAGVVSGTKSVGTTEKKPVMENLNDLLRGVGGNPAFNDLSKSLDEFVASILPEHCKRLEEMQKDFFKNLHLSPSLQADEKVTKALEDLTSSIFPALCDKNNTKNLVSKSATTDLFNQLSKFVDWINESDKSGVKKRNDDK